jgi:hypothetical protein
MADDEVGDPADGAPFAPAFDQGLTADELRDEAVVK